MVTGPMAGRNTPIRVGVVGANPNRGWGTAADLPARRALDEYKIRAVAGIIQAADAHCQLATERS
jgi:hypothetical protein